MRCHIDDRYMFYKKFEICIKYKTYLIQFHKTQGNHSATPTSMTRNTTSCQFLLYNGTLEKWINMCIGINSEIYILSYFIFHSYFVFQNSLSVSLNRKPTIINSMNAWESNPNLDWCNWDTFTCCMCKGSDVDVDGTGSNNFAVTWSSAWIFVSSVRLFVAIEATWYSFKNPPRI